MVGDALPSGLVTFVFTDIEGSTRLFRALGGEYVAVLERHNELLRETWRRHGGVEVKTEGDAFFVAFGSASDAVVACVAAQGALAAEGWGGGVEVRVRMGVHTGLAAPRDGDYIAYAVHQAARVVGAAHGGQVIASPDAVAAAGQVQGVQFLRLGRFRVRDFEEPIELFQVTDGAVDRVFPAVRATPADGHNLTRHQDSFIGRERDLSGVVELLGQHRLVSLVGPGGVGKTRLAIEAGLRMTAEWPGGVWMVRLSPLSDGAQVAAALAEALGVSGAGSDTVAAIVDHLGDVSAVVVLDNCEHVLDASAGLARELLARCDHVAVLATSREPLGLSAEVVRRPGPLQESAVDLFVDRARHADARFDSGGRAREVIAAICRRVDALPLAIELCAARVDKLSLEAILVGLDDRLGLLRSHRRDVDLRQRSLEALLGWSYDLLDDLERPVLRRLAVFADSFSMEGAEAVAGWGNVDEGDVVEMVWALVDKSLVVPDTSDNESRYRLLHTIRTFGRAQLNAATDEAETWRRAGRWFAANVGPRPSRDPRWLRDAHVEADNMRAAIHALATSDAGLAQQLACSLALLADAEGTYREGIPELEGYLALLPDSLPERLALLGSLRSWRRSKGKASTPVF